MRIHHLTAYRDGGAGVAAQRLDAMLNQCGVESRIFFGNRKTPTSVANGGTEDRWNQRPGFLPRMLYPFRRLWLKALKRKYLRGQRGYFSFPWQAMAMQSHARFEECDILHLHWVSRLIDYPHFFASWPREKPIVWTLHDMNPVTGGCHHSDTCENYRSGCGNCPMLNHAGPKDLSRRVFQTKEAAFQQAPFHVVAPSRWMESVIRQSPMARHFRSIRTIYNGIEPTRFRPIDRLEARRRLQLDNKVLVLGYGAESLTNKRKGIDEFLSLLEGVAEQRAVVGLLFGNGSVTPAAEVVKLKQLGALSTDEQLSTAYSAMDVFVSPTHAEVLGQAILEAQACETPVAAFDVGGVSESVAHGQTGLLAPLWDVAELTRNVVKLAHNAELTRSMGRAGRARVENEFSARHNAQRYQTLYQELMSE